MNSFEVEFLFRRHDEDVPQFAREVEMPAVRHGRRGEALTALGKSLAEMNGAGAGIEAGEDAIVIAAKEQVAHDQRSLHVVALTSVRPRDERIRLARIFRRDLARCLGTNRLHRPPATMRARQVNVAVREDRRGHRNVPAAVERPDFRARGEVISRRLMPAIRDDLRALRSLHQGRRSPGRHLLSRRAPQFTPIVNIEARDERTLLHIAQHNHFPVMNDGRTGEAPLRSGRREVAGIHRTEILFPDQLPVRVEAEQTLRAEDRDDVFAVGGRSGIAVTRLRVALHFRNRFQTKCVPDDFAGHLVEREQPPLLRVVVVGRVDVAVKPHLQLGLLRRDHRRDVDALAHHDGTRVRQPWNRRVPADVLARLDIPGRGQRATCIHTARGRPAVLWPVGANRRSELSE